MSDLAKAIHLDASSAQLPVYTYFDVDFYALEKACLFDSAAVYYGHDSMVPHLGDYYTIPWLNHGKMLMRGPEGVNLLSNVCRHRQALMLEGAGNTPNIVCPIHRWTYDQSGLLLGAPHFPHNPCLNLGKTPLSRWNGLLFGGGRDIAQDLAGIHCAPELDFSQYLLGRAEVTEYNFNWKTFIEVYLEDYHVAPFHPGLGGFVNCDELKWQFGEHYSVQTVGVQRGLSRPGSAIYARWHQQALAANNGATPRYGAIWLTYYPNIMVEWYPHTLVVSEVLPNGPEQCRVITDFYYPEEIALFEPEVMAAEQAAYFETAKEDDEICERMYRGRRALWLRGENQMGPYQSPMEDGMLHFHEYVRRTLNGVV